MLLNVAAASLPCQVLLLCVDTCLPPAAPGLVCDQQGPGLCPDAWGETAAQGECEPLLASLLLQVLLWSYTWTLKESLLRLYDPGTHQDFFLVQSLSP